MKTKNAFIGLALIAGLAIAAMFAGPRLAMTAAQLSEQTAINRVERFMRPEPANVTTAASDTVMTVAFVGTDPGTSVFIDKGGDTISAYYGSTLDPEFPQIYVGDSVTGSTNADVCAAIDSLADYTCSYFTGGDCLGFAAFLSDERYDITDAAQQISADTSYGSCIVLPARGAGMTNYLYSISATMDGLTSAAQVQVLNGFSATDLVWLGGLVDYNPASINATALEKAFAGPGLIAGANNPVLIRLWAHEVWSAARINVQAGYYGW